MRNVKTPLRLFAIATILLLAGCSKVLDYRNAEVVNGKVYAQGDNSPFSGNLTNVPMTTITNSQPGFVKVERAVESASFYAEAPNPPVTITHLGIPAVIFVCDAHIKGGLLEGNSTCMNRQSDTARVKMSFSEGMLNGSFHYYDETGKTLLSEASFKSGNPDGTQKVYSPISSNLLLSVPWVGGVISGTEKGYYGSTGKQALESFLNDEGKLDGKLTEWSPDGTLIHQVTYANGQKDGIEETFFPDTGKLQQHSEWKNGNGNGSDSTYDKQGNVVSSAHYIDNHRAYTPDEIHAIAQQDASGVAQATQQSRKTFDTCMTQSEEQYAQNQNQNVITDDLKTRADAAVSTRCQSLAQDAQDRLHRDLVAASGFGFEVDTCIDSWASDYQKSQPPNALISEDLLGQWRNWCAEGKTPS